MTNPISVLSRAERGSKLKEPMKIREPSIENVFACKLEAELPPLPEDVWRENVEIVRAALTS